MILPERLENGILRDSVFRSLKGRMSVRMRRTMIPPVSCGGIVQRAVSQIEITLFEVNIDFQELFGVICCCFYMSVVQCENYFLFLSCRASGRYIESVFALSSSENV